jgi:SAM-dependent methyltransferase
MYQPSKVENDNVLEIYKQICNSFSDTRFNAWPCVKNYIDSQTPSAKGFEIGCGNGKNMLYAMNKGYYMTGIDTCQEFVQMCKERGISEVFNANCVSQTFVDEQFDFALSIAVFHHISTSENRNKSLDNMINILKIGGNGLVTVWAVEQPPESKKKFKEGDNMVSWSKPYYDNNNVRHFEILERYYYVYSEKMFRAYIDTFKDRINVIRIFNEYGNWVCEFQKIK